jgi:hypothetical protein
MSKLGINGLVMSRLDDVMLRLESTSSRDELQSGSGDSSLSGSHCKYCRETCENGCKGNCEGVCLVQ